MAIAPAIGLDTIARFDPRAAWTRFDPQPIGNFAGQRCAVPHRDGHAHPLAERAARALGEQLRCDPTMASALGRGGKMFGVLVVDAGPEGIGWLRAFSGMIARRWLIEGFAPPCFDLHEVATFWPSGEDELVALTERIAVASVPEREALLRSRKERSRALWDRLYRAYRIADGGGKFRALDAFFSGRPPSGAGDCAGPKLLALAQHLGMRALALAETWWGPDRPGRQHGRLYAPCGHKCGPLLAHMLR